jgi:superfamily II DNA or RNA helicase
MRLLLGNLYTRPTDETPEDRQWLGEYLAFRSANFRGRARVQSMINAIDGSFPTGFVPLVMEAAKRENRAISVSDVRGPRPAEFVDYDLSIDARGAPWMTGKWDFQPPIVRAAASRGRGILWVPTGAGKSNLIAALCRALPCRWLVVVDSAQLANDLADTFERRCAEEAGRIGEGKWSTQRATFATFQTIARRLAAGDAECARLLDEVRGLLIDEGHTLPAESFWRVAMACGAYYRIATSATPLARGDRKSQMVIGATGRVIYRVWPEELIRRGVLSRPRIRMVELSQIGSPWLDYDEAYRALISESHTRNRLLAQIAKRAAKPGIAFVRHLDHADLLLAFLIDEGVRAEVVQGDDSVQRRRAAIARLVAGEVEFIVSTAVFTKGVDIPSLRSVVVGAGEKSVIASLQRIGRGSRTTEGKSTFEVWDIFDRGGARWLEDHSEDRAAAYRSEGYEVQVGDHVRPVQLRLG